MNSRQISSILQSTLGDKCYGVYASDQLPEKIETYPAGFVMNIDPSDRPGSHWVAVYIDTNQRGEYFDSYGREPTEPALWKLLDTNCIAWGHNKKHIQGFLSSVCGHYSIYFLINRAKGLSMNEIVGKFTEKHEENDFLITEWINDNFDLSTDTYNIDFIVNQICHALFSP